MTAESWSSETRRAAVARWGLCKHVPVATDMSATVEELLEPLFSTRSVPRLVADLAVGVRRIGHLDHRIWTHSSSCVIIHRSFCLWTHGGHARGLHLSHSRCGHTHPPMTETFFVALRVLLRNRWESVPKLKADILNILSRVKWP
jgi:hypothetical protein